MQAGQFRNVPGQVTGDYDSGIKGSFRLTAVMAPDGIPSTPSGGACIIFPAKDLHFNKMAKIQCDSDEQCSVEGENKYGYCHKATKECWSRPTAADADRYLCRRGVSSPVGEELPISDSAAPISTKDWKIKRKASARVLTCLNGIPPGGCGTPPNPKVYEWGPAKQL